MFVGGDDCARRPFEMEPGEVTRPAANERLRESEEGYKQARGNGYELRFDSRAQHVGDRDAKRSAKHQVRHNSQRRQKNSKPEKKDSEREPFDAAQVSGDFRLRRGINRLEKSFAKNSMVDNRAVDKPTEARRAVNLPAPFRGAGRAEEDQVLEAKKRFGFPITFLLFAKSAQGEPPMVPDDRRGAKCDRVSGLLDAPAKIHVVTGRMIFRIEATDAFERPAIPRHVTTWNVFRDRVGEQNVARPARRSGDARLHPVPRRRRNVRAANPGVFATQKRAH